MTTDLLVEERRATVPITAPPRTPVTRDWQHLLALLAICLGGLALRIYEFRGFGAVDDAAYAQFAHQIAEGTFKPGTYQGAAVFPLRMGIIYPTALLYRYVGVSEWTMVLFPFVLSVLSILLAYVATKHFFGRRAALIGAAIWAFLPLDAFHAGILVPDLPAAFFASLGIVGLLLLLSSPLENRSRLFLGGLGAGLSFGVSWLCKESVAYLVPFCAVLLVAALRRDFGRYAGLWAGVAVGSLAVLVGEMAAYYVTTGDWLFHVHETERNYRQYKNAFFVSGSSLAGPEGSSYAKAVVRRLVRDGPMTILFTSQYLYLPLFASIVCLHAAYWRNKAYLLPALWFTSLAFMFNFASSSFSSYVPLVLFERYLYPLALPATILVAGFLATLFPTGVARSDSARRERIFWGAAVATALFLLGGYKNYSNRKWYPGWVSEVRTLSGVLKPTDRVYTDILSIHGLEFFWSYPRQMNTVNFEDADVTSAARAGDYVLVNANYLDWLVDKAGWWPTKSDRYVKPALSAATLSTWEKVWSNGNGTLYRVR